MLVHVIYLHLNLSNSTFFNQYFNVILISNFNVSRIPRRNIKYNSVNTFQTQLEYLFIFCKLESKTNEYFFTVHNISSNIVKLVIFSKDLYEERKHD